MSINNKIYKLRNVEILFTDLLGVSRTVIISKKRLKSAIKNGLKCDGSSIYSSHQINDSDLEINIDKKSRYFLPNNNMLFFANTTYDFDARQNLLAFESQLKKQNLIINIGAELEFFLFDKNSKNNFYKNFIHDKKIQNDFKKNSDKLHYFQFDNDSCYEAINEILDFCNQSKINIEQCHHECANNQFEIDFAYDTPTKTADKIIYLKKVISFFAEKHDLYACFLPKPIKNQSGSGMHINISISNNQKKNLFYDKNGKYNLSEFAIKFACNIIKHIDSITAIANPIENSYDRLNAKLETPTKICINQCDRSALIRVPKITKKSARIELRSPDVACNPYLTFLCVIKAGFENKKTKKNVITSLPKNLDEALCFLKNDKVVNIHIPENYYKICKKT